MFQIDNSFGPNANDLPLASEVVPAEALANFTLPESLIPLLSKADQMLGRLDGMLAVMPHQRYIVDCLLRREALASARMDGNFSSFAELAHLEQQRDTSAHHTIPALNQLKALRHAMQMLESEGTLSSTLLRDIYEIIHNGEVDEASKATEARKAHMAGSHIVAYEPPAMRERNEGFVVLSAALEGAVKAGLASHSMLLVCARLFASIPSTHPLFEREDQLQRFLIPLLLTRNGTLHCPTLCLSPILCKYQDQSRRLLRSARFDGDWMPWLEFFLETVATSAEATVNLIIAILHRLHADEAALNESRMNQSVGMLVLKRLRVMLYTSPTRLATEAGITLSSTDAVLSTLMHLGIVAEQPPRPGRMICYLPLLRLLEEGTVAG